jgi:cytochrome c oxidase subunit 1
MLVLPFILGLMGIGPGAVDTGWTLYAPLSIQSGWGMDFAIFAVHMLGVSSILGAINVIVTILNMRAPGMTLMKMPLFAHGFLMTAILLITIMPVFAGGVTMVLMDRHFGTHFFSAAGGGDPVLWQHIFWFMGHPEVYVLLLPIAGAVPHVLSAFARKPVYGYRAQVYGLWGIAALSVIVWAHHMFTSGMSTGSQLYFMDRHLVAWFPVVRNAHAICDRLCGVVRMGWFDGSGIGRRGCRSPIPQRLFPGCSLPLRAVSHNRDGCNGSDLLLAPQVDWAYVG